ncbi:hypothetical protein V8G54_016995 [Vigna mungo]|uniref:Uncharacterized protein n=1 Tax=Vigna mungo TaxID=3915 RepID=A0AAQ3NL54_VIGMU
MGATQLDERVEGKERGLGERESANEGVVHEGVGVGEVVEEPERVVESIGDGNGTVKEEFAKHKGVCVKTGFHDVTVDLLRGFQVSALAKQTNNPSFFHSLPQHSSR